MLLLVALISEKDISGDVIVCVLYNVRMYYGIAFCISEKKLKLNRNEEHNYLYFEG